MIVAESVGFSATHTISEILRNLPDFEVSHGSRDFVSKRRIGEAEQSPADFARSMADSHRAGRRPVAVHTIFDPAAFKPACQVEGIDYKVLIREPEKQIRSCYAWIAKKVLDGDPVALAQAINVGGPLARKMKVRANLSNLLYIFAVSHVCSFNAAALAAGAEVVQVEPLLQEEARFREIFAIAPELSIPHFEQEQMRLASHVGTGAIDALAEPESHAILNASRFDVGSLTLTFDGMKQMLGY